MPEAASQRAHQFFAFASRLLPKSVAARLYSTATLTNLVLAALAFASVYHVKLTENVANSLFGQTVATGAAADVEILLERHRRIIMAAPAQMDRAQIIQDRKVADKIAQELRKKAADDRNTSLKQFAEQLPGLLQIADNVLLLSENFAQEEAIRTADAYEAIADKLRRVARDNRELALLSSNREVSDLVALGNKFTRYITFLAVLAIALVGTLNAFVVRNLVMRIKRITDGMRRVALNETSVAVPSITDRDEIGEMARALEIFKRNAATVVANSAEIEKLNGWFDIALNNMARGLSMFDAEERLIVCNRRYLEMYDVPEALMRPGTQLSTIIDDWISRKIIDADGGDIEQWLVEFRNKIAAQRPFSETHNLSDGRVVTTYFQPLATGGWVDMHEDVTDQRMAEARINHLARFDTLTSLANRHHFHEQLDTALRQADQGRNFAIIWLDLDKFKEVNDTLGHPVGDALLQDVAKRLTATVRSTDIVARLGGDEFAILLNGEGVAQKGAEALANRVIIELSRPFNILGQTVTVGTSIGIALAPEHGNTADQLLKNADIALYRAKTEGRGRAVFFNDEMELKLRSRRRMEIELRAAVANRSLELYYQPLMSLRTGRVTTCEALMRWNHPELGFVSPGEFIPLAESIGLIGDMGAWALEKACRDAASWPEHVRVAVNLSATQFATDNLLASTHHALAASRLAPERLELEVTETVLLQDNAGVLDTLQHLRALGLAIALDDFGTGYSSLNYLRSFPFDKIKIDQSFVRDLPRRDDCVAIVRGVVNLAKTLGMSCVAEGVETAEHLGQVAAAGCEEVQGYYFSRPVPASEIVSVIALCESRIAGANAA